MLDFWPVALPKARRTYDSVELAFTKSLTLALALAVLLALPLAADRYVLAIGIEFVIFGRSCAACHIQGHADICREWQRRAQR